MSRGKKPKVALVHDWLVSHRGGENVLEEIAALFPEAPIYTLVHDEGSVSPELESHPIRTSFVQALPGSPRRFRPYLLLFPKAIEAFDLKDYDLILSTSHCVAKGVRLRPGQAHISYVHTPMRYIWEQMPHYLPERGRPAALLAAKVASAPLRRWDRRSGQRPTMLLANSRFVAARIQRCWGRGAQVLYPPVDVGFFSENVRPADKRDGYLLFGALVPYKRADLAIEAARVLGFKLRVIGDGPQLEPLRASAPQNVEFFGRASREVVRRTLAESQALIFPGVEDFGIVPLEATAAGCPVVAMGQGGALETVVPGVNGLHFHRQEVGELVRTIQHFEAQGGADSYDPGAMLAHAQRFSPERFREGYRAHLAAAGFEPAQDT